MSLRKWAAACISAPHARGHKAVRANKLPAPVRARKAPLGRHPRQRVNRLNQQVIKRTTVTNRREKCTLILCLARSRRSRAQGKFQSGFFAATRSQPRRRCSAGRDRAGHTDQRQPQSPAVRRQRGLPLAERQDVSVHRLRGVAFRCTGFCPPADQQQYFRAHEYATDHYLQSGGTTG